MNKYPTLDCTSRIKIAVNEINLSNELSKFMKMRNRLGKKKGIGSDE